MKSIIVIALSSLLVSFAIAEPASQCRQFYGKTKKTRGADWPVYASDAKASGFSHLTQINRKNVTKLKPVFRWNSPDNKILADNPKLFTMVNEGRPIAIDGDVYVSTGLSQVVRIDGVTGKEVWRFNPESYKGDTPPNLGFLHRGVTYWKSKDGKDERIIYGTGDAFLYVLDAKTGLPISSFGENGRIDLLKGLARDGSDWPVRWQFAVTSPVIVERDTIIVGSSIDDITKGKENPPGDVRAFDLHTGKEKWRFATIPQKGQFGYETWKDGSAEKTGQANVWSIMTVDRKKGYVYLPTSTPTNDFYGGNRPGDGLFSESIVCLDIRTGKLIWHHQPVRHGLWDYDLPAAPNLADVVINGKLRNIVFVVTKQAFAYVYDRYTGEPIWPFIETPVLQSLLEQTSPTQPIPSHPPAFDRQGVEPSEILNQRAREILSQYVAGPLFTPPTDENGLGNNNGKKTKGTVLMPGTTGGASWAGAVVNPFTKMLFVTSVTTPRVALIEKNPDGSYRYAIEKSGFTDEAGAPYTFPLMAPPHGRVTAYDMKTGNIAWQKPMGRGFREDPRMIEALKGTQWEGQDIGWARRGHTMVTRDLLFLAQGSQQFVAGIFEKKNGIKLQITETDPRDQVMYVYDQMTGDVIHTINLMEGNTNPEAGGNANGGLMTFLDRNGKQKIVVPVGGANKPAELVFLAVED